MSICLILFISSLPPAFLCEFMFGLCRAWPGVVFYWISVGLHFAQFSLSQEELVLLKEMEVCLLQGFHLCQNIDGSGRMGVAVEIRLKTYRGLKEISI